MWDNLFSIILLNVGFSLIVALGLLILQLLSFHWIPQLLAVIATTVMFLLYIGTASMLASDIADYKALTFKKFFQYIKEVWKAALALTFVIVIQLFVFLAVFLYAKIGNLMGLFAISILLWSSVIWWLASQYYFPVRSRLDTNIRKVLFKCFVVFFDNTFFTLFLAFGTLVLLILSSVTAFILPGISTILLWHQVGLKLRLYKYDYLEQHAGAQRRNIPWDELLIDERERVGKRTLKGLIFPWKE